VPKQTTVVPRQVSQPVSGDNGFAESMMLGYATNNGLIGGLVGGNLAGGIVGDALNASEPETVKHDPAPEVSSPSSYDSHSSSSHDSGYDSHSSSSYDSGYDNSYDSSGFDSSSW
jgi:hypothetical protein